MHDWKRIWEDRRGYWEYSYKGDPKKQPHALLTSGKHSDGYGNSRKISDDPDLLAKAGTDMRALVEEVRSPNSPSAVFGLETSAVPFAEAIGTETCLPVGSVGKDKERTLTVSDGVNLFGSYVLLVEDVITTGGSVLKAIEALEREGATVLPHIPVVLNRSGKQDLEGRGILALVDQPMRVWSPEECPLCAKGSEALRPKENWGRFTSSA